MFAIVAGVQPFCFVKSFYKRFLKKVRKHIVKLIDICYNQKNHEGDIVYVHK